MFHQHYERGDQLWSDEDDSQVFAIVVSGTVKIYKMLTDGRQQIVGLMFSSDCLGRAFSATQQTFAEAASEVELCCFPRKKFEELLGKHPELEHALLEKTLNDLDNAREWMIALGRKTAQEKIASFLLQMTLKSRQYKCDQRRPLANVPTFVLPLGREEIADYLGLTIETVSRHFTKLRAAGIIDLIDFRTIKVCEPDELARLSEPD